MNKNIETGYVCQRCAVNSPTCCRLGTAGKSYAGEDCFPLSSSEHERIAQAIRAAKTGKPNSAKLLLTQKATEAIDTPSGEKSWAVEEANSANFIKTMRNLFPLDKAKVKDAFLPEQSHLRLALAPDGACVFLSEHGCTLPQEARPWFCRIFPFWVVGKTVQCFHDESCLAIQENSKSFLTLLQTFAYTPEEIRACFTKLKQDWGLD